MNNWLKSRAKLYEKYAKQLPSRTEIVYLNFEKPDAGWIEMNVSIEGWANRSGVLHLSCVQEPFVPMVRWLESILDSRYNGAAVLKIDSESCEEISFTMYYEPILYCSETTIQGEAVHPADCGVFYIYDNRNKKIVCDALCKTEDFVRDFYVSLKRYALMMKKEPSFVDEWVQDAYNKEWGQCKTEEQAQELFSKIIYSKTIQGYYEKKEKINYEYRGIVCKSRVLKFSLLYEGRFYDASSPGRQIKHWEIQANNKEEFEESAKISIDKILDYREWHKKNDNWKASGIDRVSIGAVFDILPKKFRNRIKSGKYDVSLNTVVKGGDYEVPLYYVTKAWDVILKGDLCSNEFRVKYDHEYDDEPVERTLQEAVRQNDEMKELWKELLNIDFDSINVDFSKFDKHLQPNVSEEEFYEHFVDVPNGIEEWILEGINTPNGKVSFDQVSSLMEFTAYILSTR